MSNWALIGPDSTAYAFSSTVGIVVPIDSDGDGIPDSDDICPNDYRNDCYKCSFRNLGACFGNIFSFLLDYLPWAIAHTLIDSLTGKVPVPGNIDPEFDYRSAIQRLCESEVKEPNKEPRFFGEWYEGTYGNKNQTGCVVGTRFWPE